MRKPTMTHVTLNTVEQCRSAATQIVKAYRLGSHRVIGKVKTSNQRVSELTKLAAKGVDLIIAETGDGIMGEYGVQAILADAEAVRKAVPAK